MFEGLPRQPQETPPDPTTFSSLPPGEYEKSGETIVTSEGERWHRIRGDAAEVQQVVARLLKGILNVSDVVEIRTGSSRTFYSKEMPHADIEQATSPEETEADLMLLNLLFGDNDHEVFETGGKNLTKQDDRVSYYDFHIAKGNFLDKERHQASHMRGLVKLLTPEAKKVLKEKLLILKQRLEGGEGKRFVETIARSTGTPLFHQGHELSTVFRVRFNSLKIGVWEKEPDFLLRILRERVQLALSVVR